MHKTKTYQDKTDEDLVILTLKDQDNFLYLMERYKAKLLRYVMRISNLDRHGAEDILQEVFIKIYQNLNDFDSSLKFSSWIYRITHNQVISNYRKVKVRPQIITWEKKDDFLNNLASDFDLNKEMDLRYLKKDIDKILGRLDIKYREILILRFLEDKDYKEISDILRKPMGTVATLINRAKKQFKKIYEKQRNLPRDIKKN